jgi:hypothetical protein
MSARVTETDNMAKLHGIIKELSKLEVYVGIPDDKSPRENDTSVTNAELMFIHTNGSPLRGIPARPSIEPSIEKNEEAISAEMKVAMQLALEGKADETKLQLDRVGDFASGKAREYFTDPDNGWEANSPLTVALKGSDKPLIDTGEMRKSITYLVGEKS